MGFVVGVAFFCAGRGAGFHKATTYRFSVAAACSSQLALTTSRLSDVIDHVSAATRCQLFMARVYVHNALPYPMCRWFIAFDVAAEAGSTVFVGTNIDRSCSYYISTRP